VPGAELVVQVEQEAQHLHVERALVAGQAVRIATATILA
jgi:hypothetical protein